MAGDDAWCARERARWPGDRRGVELGLPAGNVHRDLDAHWSEVVGADVAAHARLVSVRDGVVDGRRRRPHLGDPVALPRDRDRGARRRPSSAPVAVTSVRVRVGDPAAEGPRNRPEHHRFGALVWYTENISFQCSDLRFCRFSDPVGHPSPNRPSGLGRRVNEVLRAWRTPPRTSPFSRVSNRSANGPGCTSDPPARPASTTSSTRSSTTRSTRRWRATAPASTSPSWPTAAAASPTTAAASRSTTTPSTRASRRPRSS